MHKEEEWLVLATQPASQDAERGMGIVLGRGSPQEKGHCKGRAVCEPRAHGVAGPESPGCSHGQ